MARLVPAIHVFAYTNKQDVDARHKAGGFGRFLPGIFRVRHPGAAWGLRAHDPLGGIQPCGELLPEALAFTTKKIPVSVLIGLQLCFAAPTRAISMPK